MRSPLTVVGTQIMVQRALGRHEKERMCDGWNKSGI